jgi:hypothetical protein
LIAVISRASCRSTGSGNVTIGKTAIGVILVAGKQDVFFKFKA